MMKRHDDTTMTTRPDDSMKTPLISVIVPVYNAEKYLARCIDSILGQTHAGLELLLVDDGSRDRSGAICDDYASRDGRVRVIHKPNGGVSAARNDGIEASRGEFIAFCDNDDFYAPGMLERLLGMCLDNDCDIAECRPEKGLAESLDTPPRQPAKVLTGRRILDNFYVEASPYVWDKLYRRKVWAGVRFPVGSYTDEDVSVVHHLMWAADKVAITREKLYYHYRNPGSVMQRGFDVRWATGAMDDRLDFARREGLVRLYADTMAERFYKEGFMLVMNGRYNRDEVSRREFAAEHKARFGRYYSEAMRTPGISTKDKLFMSARRWAPSLAHLYNYLKWNVAKGHRDIRWGEVK